MASELLERSRELSALGEALAAVRSTSRGRLVLIAGEAGVGKTALVRRFCDEQRGSARVLSGACDALFTPRPLGPLLDIAETTGGELERVLASAARAHEVATALLHELQVQAPTVVVVEDLHWADEATLDVLRLLGRRVEAVPALVLASYRDEGLDHAAPLLIVLGELATGRGIDRVELSSLSPAAVARLAEPHGVNAAELYRKTGGNPFYVTEVLAAGGEEEIPRTIRDAVLARLARVSPAARALLEAVAVVPQRAELWLIEALAGAAIDRLGECLRSGMLMHGGGGVAFRHELARVAVEQSLLANRAVALHRMAIAALVAPAAGGAPDLAQLAHHAEAAGDAEAVLRFAPAAGARAASLGAHREAAAQYARALRFAGGLPAEAHAELLERRSFECFVTYQFGEAIEAQRRALDRHRERGNVGKEGESLVSLSRLLWHSGRTAEAAAAARGAVALLERLPPGRELAMAYSAVSALCMNAEDADETAAWGARAIELAQRLGDTEIVVHALNNLGTMEFLAGSPKGREKLERSLELARRARLDEGVARALNNLAWAATRLRSYALADHYLKAGLEYFGERDLVLWPPYMLALRARSQLDQGRWAEAADTATLVVDDPRNASLDRPLSLGVLGLVRARRGDPEPWAPLDEALALVQPTGELQRIAPVAAARAEALWLEGRLDAVAEATEAALDLARRRGAAWEIGELACWRSRAGIREEIRPDAAEPYALQLAGDWARAAQLWTEIGCPYEAALALADADDDDALRRALAELQRLGGRPAAAIVARRLRERGARGLPRGPRPATRQNPAHLTPRELEVLALVAQGLRNCDIAARLVLAEKTIDHHVSAILRKLGVHTRRQASAEARRLGLTRQDG